MDLIFIKTQRLKKDIIKKLKKKKKMFVFKCYIYK